jgi:streptogramin lyase
MRVSVRIIRRAAMMLGSLLFVAFIIAPPAFASVTITEYTTPTGSGPHGMVVGPDGNMWFTEFGSGKIGVMSPSGTLLHEYSLPSASSNPNDIIIGPDGNLWFTEYGDAKVGVMKPDGTLLNEYTTAANPHEIVVGPDGDMWFTDIGNGKIGQITTSGTITYFPTATTLDTPYGITIGPDGNIWFTEFGVGEIGRMNTSGVVLDDFPLPTTPFLRKPYEITTGPDGNMWFTGEGGLVSKMTLTGDLTEYTTPSGSTSDPHGIVTGPDGNIWFTERAGTANKVGMVTTSGVFTEYAIPTASSAPFMIKRGPNNTLWFGESATDKLGVIGGLTIPSSGGGSTTGTFGPSSPDTGFGAPQKRPFLAAVLTVTAATGLITLGYILARRPKQPSRIKITK